MEKDLTTIIADYFTEVISKNIREDISINWSYNPVMNHFVMKFELANTQFLIIARSRNSRKSELLIEPAEHQIKIECQNYLKNFEQVAAILGEFEKELKYFDKILPSFARRQYIQENFAATNQKRTHGYSSQRHNIHLMSEKYLSDNCLMDKSGVKEIALDHLFAKEYFINMKKKN